MAKKKVEGTTSDDFFKVLAKETQGGVLNEKLAVSYFIDSGNLALNYASSGRFLKGGIPGGKLIEAYGPPSSSKSLVATNLLRGCQKIGGIPIIFDCENATNADFMAKASHLDCSKVIRYTPETIERCFNLMCQVIDKIREKKGNEFPILIVYDSIGVSPCEREFAETKLPQNYKPADWKRIVGRKEQPGERAKACNAGLRKINSKIEKTNTTIFVINQTREKIGVLYGNPETTAGGGNALPFYASCRMRTQTQKKIIHAQHKTVVGVNLKIKNVKNRAFRPFVEIEGIKLYFDHGIDPLSGLTNLLVQEERIKKLGSGNYSVMEKYLPKGMDKYNFKTAEADSFPKQVLLDCPAIIDATSKSEIEEYLKDFTDAIDTSNSGKYAEKSVHMGDLDELVDSAVEDSDEQMGLISEEYDKDPETPE